MLIETNLMPNGQQYFAALLMLDSYFEYLAQHFVSQTYL